MHFVLIVLLGYLAWKFLVAIVRLFAVLFILSFRIIRFMVRLPWLGSRWLRGDRIVRRPKRPAIPMPDLTLDANSVHMLRDDRPAGVGKYRIVDCNPPQELAFQRHERLTRMRKNRPLK